MPNATVTVFHPMNPVNGGRTSLSGPDINVYRRDDGSLEVGPWETHTQRGRAYFAAGQWSSVLDSIDKPKA